MTANRIDFWNVVREDGLTNWQYAQSLREQRHSWDQIGKIFGLSGEACRKTVARYQIPAAEPREFTEAEAIALLTSRGFELQKPTAPTLKEIVIDHTRFDGDWVKFGLVGDTQLGSRYAQVTLLHEAYDFFEREGITDVLHVGDVTDGQHMYRGHEFELAIHGADAQVEYICERYPRRNGIKTRMISGNHDLSYMKNEGMDIVKRICECRDDMEYLGRLGAYVTIGPRRIYLMHPTGGVAYARSYHLQRIIEQFSPENKPDVLVCGHWHVNSILPMYRNVFGASIGCFQSQTPYLVAKGLYPEVGFAILEVCLKEGSTVGFRYQWVPMYVPKNEDW